MGDALADKFRALGITSVEDLVGYIPRRYDDYSHLTAIDRLQPGPVSIQARIEKAKGRYVRRGMHITEASAVDKTGSVKLVWFNQPYREQALKSGHDYFISGEFGLNYRSLSIINPSIELVSDFPLQTARILPIYRETKGLTSKQIRRIVAEASAYIRSLEERLPPEIIESNALLSYAEAIMQLHFPDSAKMLALAKQRLGFQEAFELMLASALNKQEIETEHALRVAFDESVAKEFVQHLPFSLTDAQRKVTWQIYKDMDRSQPMNRLVEGDVGSGKTVVAAMAAVMVTHNNMQAALMAPTEILARQHAETFRALLQPLGLADDVVLLVGGMKAAEKKRATEAIAAGKAKFIIGTHALVQERVAIQELGLVIIDEQHRFGVDQRKKLMAKAGHMPHVLSLTATPIPRSLALTLYGEMDISLLDTKPAGRQPVLTKICSPNSKKQLYSDIEIELSQGRQMFVVCPQITEGTVSARSVEQAHKDIQRAFPGRSAAVLHGKMKPEEKQTIMQRFVDHDIDILVTTTVIEVGVDVPNASIMLIESAERFGLAQIHQLRGRVGRGGHKGYCYLMLDDSQAPSRRLRALESSNDGFRLAELDLELRGPGAIYGTLQHGALDLRMVDLTDVRLLQRARQAVAEFMESGVDLLQYPQLYERIQALRKVTNLN